MKFSIATLSLATLAVVSAGYVSRGEGVSRGEKFECDFDTFEWKFALAVKELKHKGKNWGRDVDLDIVYELDDGQLFHGCRETYDASKCKNCYEAFEFNDEDNDKDCDDDCKRKKKGHRNYKRGGYSDGDCDDDCERVERCNYPFCELYDDNCDLLITLRDGVLRDERHAIGEIVANHQFQFDKPPQKDALHKEGFSIVYTEGNYYLALDHKIKFWHCKVDDKGLYKLYDESIGEQCSEIELIILKSNERAEFNEREEECDDDCKRKKEHGKKY